MTKREFETKHRVLLVRKDDDWLMRLIGTFYPAWMTEWWTTYRIPGMQWPCIAYPVGVANPMMFQVTLNHELVHAEQERTFWGLIRSALLYFLFPLPILFSGRWFVERPAYLLDIRSGRYTVEKAITILWRRYGWAWPPFLMRRWFEAQLKGGGSGVFV